MTVTVLSGRSAHPLSTSAWDLREENSLGGILRATLSKPARRDVVRKRASFAPKKARGIYEFNFQVADLNSLNADLAAIK
jgi:hypothetical protein